MNAIAAILWPLVIALILVLYRTQIVDLAGRFRRGKAWGAEAEFDPAELKTLNQEAAKAAAETSPTKPDTAHDLTDNVRKAVLAEAARSPKLGLMLLSAEIDRLARRITAASGHQRRSSLSEQLQIWSSVLPTHAGATYRLFSHVRNRIVHGGHASEAEILSAIDSGLVLYEALAAIPIERHVVYHPGVDIYSDPHATQLQDGKGVILETHSKDQITHRIFPTTKTHFVKGMAVAWEWNMSRVWGPAWYRDPDTKEVRQGWHSSAEFVGNDLAEI